MPDLPRDTGALVTNTEDGFLSGRPNTDWLTKAEPKTDAAHVPSNLSGSKPVDDRRGANTGQSPNPETPLEAMSIATRTIDAPPLGAFTTTTLHDDNYLDPRTPHISPESQRSAGIARRK